MNSNNSHHNAFGTLLSLSNFTYLYTRLSLVLGNEWSNFGCCCYQTFQRMWWKLKQQPLRNLISPINVRGVVHTGCLQHHQRTIEDRRCSISRPKMQTTLKVTWENQNRTDRSDDLCKARQQWRQPATRYQNDILASRSLKKKQYCPFWPGKVLEKLSSPP